MSTTSTVDHVIDVTDYHIFENASQDADKLYVGLDEEKNLILSAKSIICSDDVFMGPIADSCEEALEELDSRMSLALGNFKTLINYYDAVAEEYKKSDKEVEDLILSKSDTGALSYSKDAFSGILGSVCKNAMRIAADSRSTYALGWDKTKGYFYGDCFAFVLASFEGVCNLNYNPQTMGGTNPATATSYLVKSGQFTQIPITSSTELQLGDVLVCPTAGAEHAEIYIGNGQLASAPSAARPMQHSLYNFGATYILRYNGGKSA